MQEMTLRGFCEVAALSIYTSGLPSLTVLSRYGNCALIFSITAFIPSFKNFTKVINFAENYSAVLTMYDYIKGSIEELNPAEAVIECHGIGFLVQISLYTYERLRGAKECRLYIHHHLREDDETLYGFSDKEERRIFTLLISVSGIGPNTARMMLSSLTPEEVSAAVASGDVGRIKAVKGIGLKTAQKVIIELKDKIARGSTGLDLSSGGTSANTEEACSALVMLGFTKNAVEKAVSSIVRKEPGLSLEDIIKKALKIL